MIDDNGPDSRSDELPFARAYDYFKHMTGITLVSIGGIFAFVSGPATKISPTKAMLVLGFIGIAGMISLLMTGVLAALEVKPVPQAKLSKQVRLGQIGATFFLATGLGGFIQTFTAVLF